MSEAIALRCGRTGAGTLFRVGRVVSAVVPALISVSPAQAQVAGSLSLTSNAMFRGETVSRDDPAATLGLNYDGPGGFYVGASATVAAGANRPHVATAEQYAGFARRLGSTSFELGVIHRSYDRVVDEDYRRGFFEGYVGFAHRRVRGRLYVSPDYLRDGRASYYAELNARLIALGKWSLDGHGGLSLIPGDAAAGGSKLENYEDWRLQLSRPLGRLMVSTGLSATNYPVYSESGKVRAFASVMYAF